MMGTMRGSNTPAVRPDGRLKLVGAGTVLALVGAARMARGVQVVTHWTGQPMFSWGLVGAGGLCIVLAFIPLFHNALTPKEPVRATGFELLSCRSYARKSGAGEWFSRRSVCKKHLTAQVLMPERT